MINLQRLEGFYWVAKTQGYARAARAFPYPITQPGVHQQVRRLEEELGVRLFERVGKDRVVLTPRGQVLFDAMVGFYEQLPVIDVQTADLSLLRSGETDVLIDWLPEIPADIATKEIGRTEGWIVAPSHGPFAQKGRLSLSALEKVPFIGYHSDRTLKGLQLEALRQHEVSPREGFAADSSDTILGFVAAGLGFSLVPWLTAAGPRVAGVVAQRLERPAAAFPIYAAWRKGSGLHPLVEAALEVAPSR